MKKAVIMEIQRYSIHDGPGIRTTVFLKGCHMKCAWCHNPESQDREPELMYFEKSCIQCRECEAICDQNAHTFYNGKHEMNVLICRECDKKKRCEETCCSESIRLCGKSMSVDEVLQEILRDKEYYGQEGGVTFSGGEPLLQEEFLREIMLLCKEKNINIGLDTTLNVEWERIEQVLPYVDFYLIDIKSMDEKQHVELTGQSNRNLLENIRLLSKAGGRIIIRMPIVYGCNDSPAEMEQRNQLLEEIKGIERIDSIPVSNHAKEKYKALGRSIELFNR